MDECRFCNNSLTNHYDPIKDIEQWKCKSCGEVKMSATAFSSFIKDSDDNWLLSAFSDYRITFPLFLCFSTMFVDFPVVLVMMKDGPLSEKPFQCHSVPYPM